MAAMSLSVITWNVGFNTSAFYTHHQKASQTGYARTCRVLDLLSNVQPTVLCLQEMGLHEEGLPSEDVQAVFMRDAASAPETVLGFTAGWWRAWETQLAQYQVLVIGPYCTFLRKDTVTVFRHELIRICTFDAQAWRRAQHIRVEIKLGGLASSQATTQCDLVNVHLGLSGSKAVQYRADHGHGKILGLHNHKLNNIVRDDIVRHLGVVDRATLLMGDFNIDDVKLYLRELLSTIAWSVFPPDGKKHGSTTISTQWSVARRCESGRTLTCHVLGDTSLAW